MSTHRSLSRGRSQPSVRWAKSRSPSHSPSRFIPGAPKHDPAYIQVGPPVAEPLKEGGSPSRSRSRTRSGTGSAASSRSRSRSRGPDMAPRRSSFTPYPVAPGDTDYVTDRDNDRSRSRKSWTEKAEHATRVRDDNGKLVKSSLAILGALGAAAYVGHRVLLPHHRSGHDDSDKYRRHSTHSTDGPGRRHNVERHHHVYRTTYYEDAPPRPQEDYYPQPQPEPRAATVPPPRSDRAEPAWSRDYPISQLPSSTTTKPRFIEQGRPVSGAGIQPVLYQGEDGVHYIDGEGRMYVEEYRSDRFWPGARLP